MTYTELEQRVLAAIDRAEYRAQLAELIGHAEGTSKIAARCRPEIAARIAALPTKNQARNQARHRAIVASKTREEAIERIGLSNIFTWLGRHPEASKAFYALPSEQKRVPVRRTATTPEERQKELNQRRAQRVREATTMQEAARANNMTQPQLSTWLWQQGLGEEEQRLRAGTNTQATTRVSGGAVNIHFGPIRRDPKIWERAVARMPADLAWYLGPRPSEVAE